LLLSRPNKTRFINKHELSSGLKKILNFRPGDLKLYEVAFIHRSASFTLSDGRRINNERLEFLGDAVLDAILSDYLFENFPHASEGLLTKLRSRIVNRDVLNQLAVAMGIHSLLVSNIGTSNTTRNLYGDALEALVGAIFLDKGFKKTKKILIKKVLRKHLDLDTIINTDSDYKSMVFEWVQKNKANLIFTYNEEYDFKLKKSMFTTTLFINRIEYGKGQGLSKKEAEQEASSKAWKRIQG